MNVLILVSTGSVFPPFFDNLGSVLQERGHNVYYALNSKLVSFEHPRYLKLDRVSLFSDYLSQSEADPNLLDSYDADHLSELFFPDFDRFETYRYNLDKKLPWYRTLASALIGFFQKEFTKNSIDAVIYENVSNTFSYFAYIVAERFDVKYVGISGSRLPGRFELHHSIDGVRVVLQNTYNKLQSGQLSIPEDVVSDISNYLTAFSKTTPDYMKTNQLELVNPIKRYFKKTKLRVVFSRLSFVIKEAKDAYPYDVSNPLFYSFRQFIHNVSRYLRSPFVRRYYTDTSPDDEFFLYPLQFHPEASTSLHARFFVDEYVAIKNVAFSLPFGSWLYVKDHISATCYQKLRFYKQISSLPNVKLLAPHEDTKSLIAQSRAVITLTSTVGFEAIVLKKPVYVLGDVFYDFHPFCRKVRSWYELADALASGISLSNPDESVSRFLAAYWICTHPGVLRYGDVSRSDPLLSCIVQHIEQRVLDA